MNDHRQKIMEESIHLELNLADLYMVFFEQFPGDGQFWWKLAIEEKNHAALLKSIRDIFIEVAGAPDDLFAVSLEELRKANSSIRELICSCKESPISRRAAFSAALSLEETAGEMHFQDFFTGNANDSVSRIFRQLNGEDKDHARRLKEFIESQRINTE